MEGQSIIDTHQPESLFDKLEKVTVMLFDVDGVFTNSDMIATEAGELQRFLNTRDGYGVKHALNAGYTIGIITKGNSQGVESRFRNLGVEHVYMNMPRKIDTYNELKSKLGFSDASVLYMGDDLSDLEVLQTVGIAACPYDAVNEVIEASDYIAHRKGGDSCVREVIEKVLRLQSKW